MAIGYDTFLRSLRTNTSDPYSFTYTPVGEPRGILLWCYNIASTTQHISSATYGGVDMGSTIFQGAFNGDALDVRFLGSGILPGAQTVSLDLSSGTTDDLEVMVLSVTANGNVEAVNVQNIQASVDDPSMTMSQGGRTCMSFAYGAINIADPANVTENANMTSLQELDRGSYQLVLDRQTTAGSSDFVMSWTTSASSACLLSSIALSEILATAPGRRTLLGVGA